MITETAIDIAKQHNVNREDYTNEKNFLKAVMDRLEGRGLYADQMTYILGLYIKL